MTSGIPDDQGVLETYIERFRTVFRTRMVTVTLLAIGVGACFSMVAALQFIVVHYALFALYIWAVEHCAKRVERPGAMQRLRLQTALIAFLIACHGAGLAVYVAVHAPKLNSVCIIMLITMFVLTGLQVHLSRWAFLVCMTPFIVGLSILTKFGMDSPPEDFWAAGIFCLAVVAASWRQQVSDETSAVAAAALARRNADLRVALASAEAANKAKTDFLAITSHEVRTPLNAVLSMAGVLRREAVGERQARLAQGIELSGNVLLRLLNSILEFAKLEAGRAELCLAPVRVGSTLDTLRTVWSSKCEEGNIHFEVVGESGINELVVQTDVGKLEQTLMNLASNAIKLTPQGGEVIVTATWRPCDDERAALRFEISDNGPGVAADERERIFQAYAQGEAGRAAGGTGLGLAICRSNLRLLGGDIGVDPRPGGGSIFWIEFAAEIAAIDDSEAGAPRDTLNLERVHILAADDHPVNREVLKLLLEPFGATLELVENGEEAVKAAASRRYDIILMDAKMPVMDGVTAVSRIRALEDDRSGRVPIVMLTANVFPEDIALYHGAGADCVVGKPIELTELLTCLHNTLRSPATVSAPTGAQISPG